MPPVFERPFTLLVGGRPILSFVASTFNEANELTREEWLRADLLKYRSNGQPLWDGDAKLSVRASVSTGALAVDNESHVAASVAAARGLPMAAVRVIMDPATRQLPAAALAAVRSNGTIDLAALIHSIVRQPSELPMLLRTALDALIGFAELLRCRQLLGPGLGLPSLQARGPELSPASRFRFMA